MMKKLLTFLFIMVPVLTLAGCSQENAEESTQTIAEEQTFDTLEEIPVRKTICLRIVDGADTGNLVLAGEEVYILNVDSIPVYLDGKEADCSVLEDGMMAEIAYSGDILFSFPAQLTQVDSISVHSLGTEQNPGGSTYDLCGLYLQVLNDLWEKDSGLNEGISYVSVDLSEAPGELTAGEISAIAWFFGNQHHVDALTLSYDELIEQGYLETVEDNPTLYDWKEGVLFTIAVKENGISSLPAIKFDAKKWRSPLGAYFLFDCTAVWPEFGTWTGYSVGGEAIS